MSAAIARRTVALGDAALTVHWPDGGVSHLPYLWLRDNCPCRQCRIEQTGEKRVLISDLPLDLCPQDATLEADGISIVWTDGHRTVLSRSAVRAAGHSMPTGWHCWPRRFQPPRIDYRSFLEDDVVARAALADFLRDGAFILCESPTESKTLERLAPRLGPLREVLFARIHDVKLDPAGYNVAHTAQALLPHNDFASYTWPPSVQVLHMLVNEVEGGESLIVDGWQVLSEMRSRHPEEFDVLCRFPVPFREHDAHTETQARAPLVRCDESGDIVGLRFSNQLMQAVDPDHPDTLAFYRAYHRLAGALSDPSRYCRFRLAGGEMLVLSAHRVLHGRMAFEATGPRHLQDAYFELDNIRNILLVLDRNAEHPS